MNNKRRLYYSYWAIMSLLLLAGSPCFGRSTGANRSELPANKANSAVARGKPVNEYARLVAKLRAQRASVKSTKERVRQPFFSVPGRIMKVNNEAIQVFDYSNPVTAESQAKLVSPDGKTLGNSKPSWMSTPHFFKSKKLIVIYVGDDQTILRILEAELGNQFAGG